MMSIAPSEATLKAGGPARVLLALLRDVEADAGLQDAHVFCGFPLYRDEDDQIVETDLLLLSPKYGVVAFALVDGAGRGVTVGSVTEADERLDRVVSSIHSRMIRVKALRTTKTTLRIPISFAIFATDAAQDLPSALDAAIVSDDASLKSLLESIQRIDLPEPVFRQLVSTIQGAGGMFRAKVRDRASESATKGAQATAVENSIVLLDREQLPAGIAPLDGPQRLRGIAGSGKTVVLAMRAAMLHLRQPKARILYTFYTKSLYQYITRMITRFHKQFSDTDPDWDRLRVLHGWGGSAREGVYSSTCRRLGVPVMSFKEASRESPGKEFDHLCRSLLRIPPWEPEFDYVLIDEGQDFPPSFMQLCRRLVRNDCFLWAYDEFQTIFQISAPNLEQHFGARGDGTPDIDLVADMVLHRCYRNPREILVCAHALGLGVYGNSKVQVLESEAHWNYVGYELREGVLSPGSRVAIERPVETAPLGREITGGMDEMVKFTSYETFDAEVKAVVNGIKADISDGLRPDDVLVVSVDDRNARVYIGAIAQKLENAGIRTNDIHSDPWTLHEFYQTGRVTLSTVHKAKGNEAFMVYVVGADACFPASWRERNKLFTAMTRAKAWVRMSGVGKGAEQCAQEIAAARKNFPFLRFVYPTEEQSRILKRDMAESESRRVRGERLLDDALSTLPLEEVERLLQQRKLASSKIKKSKKASRGEL